MLYKVNRGISLRQIPISLFLSFPKLNIKCHSLATLSSCQTHIISVVAKEIKMSQTPWELRTGMRGVDSSGL